MSQLIAEFREQDSYLDSDYDSTSSSSSSSSKVLSKGMGMGASESRLSNSIITTATSLLAAAQHAERISGAPIPRVTMRLSRIEEHPIGGHEDERIRLTFQAVRKMGVTVVFGDLTDCDLADLPRPDTTVEERLRPSIMINLDPTALMGLCSDILHHPLPASAAEVRARYFRPVEALAEGRAGRRGRLKRGDEDGDEDDRQSQNSRELVRNMLEEMESPLIEEMRETLSECGRDVEFWATKEAVRYLMEALGSDEVVGEGMEQQRMRRLLGLEQGDFFEGSRYHGLHGASPGLKVKVFDKDRSCPLPAPDSDVKSTLNSSDGQAPRCLEEDSSSFQVALARICSQFLAEYLADPFSPNLSPLLQSRRNPVSKVATFTLPFSVVSLISLERGAAEGMTTLMMGNVVLRELFSQPRWKIKGWCHGNYEMGRGRAAVWMLPYRSLGEGKRVKFARGDYSYPRR